MFKKKVSVILISFLLIVLFSYKITMANENKDNDVLILYDCESIFSLKFDVLNSLSQLMGAYNKKVSTEKISTYSNDDISKYKEVIVLSIEGNINNKFLLDDLKNYKNKIYYIGKGISNLLNIPNYNLEYSTDLLSIESITYSRDGLKENNQVKTFSLVKNIEFTMINEKYVDKVYSYVSDGRKIYPNIWEKGNLYHMELLPEENLSTFMLADSLNDFFDVKREGNTKILVEVGDVNVFRNPKELMEIADYLYGEGIPFIVGLIPINKNLENGNITKLSDMPKLIEALKYMQDKGGSIVLNGYEGIAEENTYEDKFQGRENSKASLRNWDFENYMKNDMGDGLNECVKNEVYPLGFEAPKCSMDSGEYKEIKKYFSTYIGQYESDYENIVNITYPYILENTSDFNMLLSQNLGSINSNKKTWFYDFERNYDILTIARAPVGEISYNSSDNVSNLKKVINYLKSENVEFSNLKDYNNWIRWNDIKIESRGGKVLVNYTGNTENVKDINSKNYKEKKSIIYSINNILIYVVSGFIIVFIIIFINFKRKGKRKFYR